MGHTSDVQDKRDESVMRRKWLQHLIYEYNMLEVIDHTLAVQEIHRRRKPIPIQALREAQSARPRRNVRNGNNLLEGDNLDSGDNQDDVDVAHSHGEEECPNHDEGPYCARDEGLLLLLVLGGLGVLVLFTTLATITHKLYRNGAYLFCDICAGAWDVLGHWLAGAALTYV